jgi:hypothetical protein
MGFINKQCGDPLERARRGENNLDPNIEDISKEVSAASILESDEPESSIAGTSYDEESKVAFRSFVDSYEVESGEGNGRNVPVRLLMMIPSYIFSFFYGP